MYEWNAKTIRERAMNMKASAKADEERATLRTQFAVTLEDIAAAWEQAGEQANPEPWLIWGNKFKCPKCGAVTDKQTPFCAECGKVMKV